MRKDFLSFVKKYKGRIALILAIFYLALFFIGSFIISFAEKEHISEALWRTIVFFFSGIEVQPNTILGRVVASIFTTLGQITISGIVVGTMASIIIKSLKEVKMPKDIKDHIVICNWNERGDKIINELHHPEVCPNSPIIIITSEKIDEEPLRRNERYQNVYFVYGDPTLHYTLKKGANVHLAKSVIILADDKYPDPDAKTALIALAIRNITQERKVYIVAEVINHRKIEHLKAAGVDEWVLCR